MGRWGDEGVGGAGGERITNAPCPMPNAQSVLIKEHYDITNN
ncbi:hypothetical protein [Nostoc linckia]|nr:hypothetical protein [Nostoc linckia]